MRAPGPQDRGKDWREVPSGAAGMVVAVGGTRTGQWLPGDRPGIYNEHDTHEARPRLRAHGHNHMAPQVAGHPVCPS